MGKWGLEHCKKEELEPAKSCSRGDYQKSHLFLFLIFLRLISIFDFGCFVTFYKVTIRALNLV